MKNCAQNTKLVRRAKRGQRRRWRQGANEDINLMPRCSRHLLERLLSYSQPVASLVRGRSEQYEFIMAMRTNERILRRSSSILRPRPRRKFSYRGPSKAVTGSSLYTRRLHWPFPYSRGHPGTFPEEPLGDIALCARTTLSQPFRNGAKE